MEKEKMQQQPRVEEWNGLSVEDACARLGSSPVTGLAREVAQARLIEFGPNRIHEGIKRGPVRIFLSQFRELFVVVLLVAAIIAAFIGEPVDSIAIVVIVILNAALGFVQEFRAERAMEALKKLIQPQSIVRRDGEIYALPSVDLVPGDIVLLEAGQIVPADLRLIEAHQFTVDESALTGESVPVYKNTAAAADHGISIHDMKNMAFKGTAVKSGRGLGVVTATAMNTELGRIAKLLKEESEGPTPLQVKMASFSKGLSGVVIALCVVIFILGYQRGENPVLMLMTALSLAVAAIPEALPAVITMSLAIGARIMSRRNALVRRLPAVEALGSVTYICSDKTGTLTENRMKASGYFVNGNSYGQIPQDWNRHEKWREFVYSMALNNDVTTAPGGILQGDPTETALVAAAYDVGCEKKSAESKFPRVAELPFSSDRGLMSTVHLMGEGGLVVTKGAPEKVFPLCRPDTVPDQVRSELSRMAERGFRVLAFANRELSGDPSRLGLHEFEGDLKFLGLVGLMDPPRPEVKSAIHDCQTSGIKVVMITGDHPLTARAIALELGIVNDASDGLLTGLELGALTDDDLKKSVRDIFIYARVAPEQKIRLVKALQAQGEIVAMTGDGVNDAPALRSADVGVAMGRGGTDVAREASHVVLLDDNFATIVRAIREGRRIYDNIRKFVRFALSGNSGEIWTLFLAPFLGLPTPLLPIHILWVNLVTDGLPGLALSLEREERGIMNRPPRSPDETIFARGLWQHTIWVGLLTAAATLGTMAWAYHTGHAHWQSMAFTVLTLVQMGHVLAIRSETNSLFSMGLRSNLPLLGAVLVTFILQMATLYVPTLNVIFKTEPLSLNELAICLLASSSVFFAVEFEKWRRRQSMEK